MTQTKMQPLEILSSLGINGLHTVIPVQGGFDMAMWKVEYEGQTYALRVFPPGRHSALLITWLAGRMVADELRARPWHVWRLGIEFGRMQAAIHAVPAPDLLRQQPEAWIAWKCEGEQTVQDRLRHLPSKEVALLHLDYHPRNVLTDGKQITGIVDWTNAHAGDPRADAARTLSILRVDPAARKPLLRRPGLRIFELAWRIGYQRERGRPKEMSLFYAWAGTVIQRDLAHRYEHVPQELTPARRWTNTWKARAGCQGLKGEFGKS